MAKFERTASWRLQIRSPGAGWTYFVDFVCRERALVIELDGATHSTDEEIAKDSRRTQVLKEKGYRVLRVTNDEVFNNIDGVCETILSALE